MSSRRVVVTGMGWVTPLGDDVDTVWARLLAGENAVAPISHFDASTCATQFAAEVRGFDLEKILGERAEFHNEAAIHTKFALGACKHAWDQARLEGSVDLDRVGIYLGAGEGVLDYVPYMNTNVQAWDHEKRDTDTNKWSTYGLENMRPRAEVEQEPQMAAAHLARQFGMRGPTLCCMTACAASTQAIGEGAEIIRRGDADIMVSGGSHTMIHPLGMTGFMRLTALSTRNDDPTTASRPFDVSRDGFVMGEGAGIVILEELEHAKARGATILAELAGFGSTADAYRITDIHPEGKGGAGAMRAALTQAGIDPSAIDESGRPSVHWVNAHGTSTQENDKTESAAVRMVFGEHAHNVPFSSIKSMMGHLIQAAGAVEMITCIKAIQTGIIPPTANLKNVDPLCGLDHVPGEARDMNTKGGVEVCLSNSFGFGGQNNTVCLRRYRDGS